ncbi:MAG: M1 family metallopeptidase [Phycisphaerales bacterium]
MACRLVRPIVPLALAALFGAAAAARADDYPRDPRIDLLHYDFALTLVDEHDTIEGVTTALVRFVEPGVDAFTLDLIGRSEEKGTGMVVRSVEAADGAPIDFTHNDDRLTIRPGGANGANDERAFIIRYEGTPADGLIISENKYGERTFFADNFPNRARHWLPTLDHPHDKATCSFTITAPDRFQVVANGRLVEETDAPGPAPRTTVWRETTPISTYLMVIGVAEFATRHAGEVDGVPVQIWVYARDREPGFVDFGETWKPMSLFTTHIGPFPFDKIAHVQSRTRYGGMENASAIFYSENAVTGGRSIDSLIAHELAHQWFGDAVTVADWNHVWLSEGFATYLAHVYFEWTEGRDRMVVGLERDRGRIVGYARQAPGFAVVDERIGVDDILSTNSYQKGSWVLHMLRREIGDDTFWRGLREYYARHRNGSVLTDDFRRAMERASGEDLRWFFDQWIFQAGHPKLEMEWTTNPATNELVVTVRQTQEEPPFRATLEIGWTDADGRAHVETMTLDGRSTTVSFACDTPPVSVRLDPNTWLLYEDAAMNGGEDR